MSTRDPDSDSVAENKAAIWAEVGRIGKLPDYRCVFRFLIHNVRETEWYEGLDPYGIDECARQGLVIALERYAQEPGIIDLSRVGVGESVILDQDSGEIVRAPAVTRADEIVPLVKDLGSPTLRVDPQDYITHFEAAMQMLRGLPSARAQVS